MIDVKVVSGGEGHFHSICRIQLLCDLGKGVNSEMAHHLTTDKRLKNVSRMPGVPGMRDTVPYYTADATFLQAITAVEEWLGFCAVRILREGTNPELLAALDELPEAPTPNPYLPIAKVRDQRGGGLGGGPGGPT